MGNITTLLFDLGGVIIELGSLEDMMSTSPLEEKEIWKGWIRSPSVQRFESGNCSAHEFAVSMIEEFSLAVTPDQFLETFNRWPRGPFKGAAQLLMGLSDDFRLACLSNSNASHWANFLRHQPVLEHFEDQFFSHEIGLLKPDSGAFDHALVEMSVSPEEVVFFDDNLANVESARSIGMQAHQVNSPDGVLHALYEQGLVG
ncbi:MAG: HAD family phosphatase [Pseudomonadales bacterium]|nr:HAD family phosphatase [Pseudomonadales bacterium]MBO6701844.1 HAD family phosphatase [Pseudomonadales bacterium]MBO7005465.1 HAD family phosphatase [Pseudomonadales bacterium]